MPIDIHEYPYPTGEELVRRVDEIEAELDAMEARGEEPTDDEIMHYSVLVVRLVRQERRDEEARNASRG
jgi:hypothetical protein